MKIGARNNLMGEVVEIKRGDVMAEVKVKLKSDPNTRMASVMTTESLDDMGLKPGDAVQIVAKAINVLLIKN